MLAEVSPKFTKVSPNAERTRFTAIYEADLGAEASWALRERAAERPTA